MRSVFVEFEFLLQVSRRPQKRGMSMTVVKKTCAAAKILPKSTESLNFAAGIRARVQRMNKKIGWWTRALT